MPNMPSNAVCAPIPKKGFARIPERGILGTYYADEPE